MCEGVIPVTIRPPNTLNLATTLPTVRMVVDVSKASAVLSTALIIRVLRSKVRHTVHYLTHICVLIDGVTKKQLKKCSEEMQTLRAGCSKAEPKIFAPPQTPSQGHGTAKI